MVGSLSAVGYRQMTPTVTYKNTTMSHSVQLSGQTLGSGIPFCPSGIGVSMMPRAADMKEVMDIYTDASWRGGGGGGGGE